MTISDKHSSLLRYEINYGCKKFYDTISTLKILSRNKPSGLFFGNNTKKKFFFTALAIVIANEITPVIKLFRGVIYQ